MARKLPKGVKAQDALGLVAGGVASNYVGKFVPFGNEKVKAIAPLIVGYLLSGQKGAVGKVGEGMIAGAGANLLKSFGIGNTPVDDVDVDAILSGDDDPIMGDDDGPIMGTDEDDDDYTD